MDTERGIDRRKTLVADEYPEAATIYVKACELYLTPKYSSFLSDKGHILDALAAAVTARRPTSELSRLPEGDDPPQDERGLTMQMVYPTDTDQTRLTGINETQTRSR
jgi:predicted RNase H-like nuclease